MRTRISSDKLSDLLAEFCASGYPDVVDLHTISPNRKVVCTDGVKTFVDKVRARWLTDAFATQLPPFVFKHGLILATCEVKQGMTRLSASVSANTPELWSKVLGLTNCPDGEWQFYLVAGGPLDTIAIMLPAEY